MFEIDGKIFRNIQEQVQKNKSDIAAIRNVESVLNEFGVRVLGKVDTESEIPEGTYEYGDAYLVGTEEPYDMYVFTRDDEDGHFIDIGPLNIEGPQGPRGERGEKGDKGDTGNTGATGNGIYTITKTATAGNVDTYTVSFTDGSSTTFNVTNGINGQDGQDGDPGQSFMIMGTISNTSLLPDPSTTPRNYAYVLNDGQSTTPDKLYYITGAVGSEVWEYSSFAAAGTTVTVNSTPVYTWNADTKQNVLTQSIVPSGDPYSILGFDSNGNLTQGSDRYNQFSVRFDSGISLPFADGAMDTTLAGRVAQYLSSFTNRDRLHYIIFADGSSAGITGGVPSCAFRFEGIKAINNVEYYLLTTVIEPSTSPILQVMLIDVNGTAGTIKSCNLDASATDFTNASWSSVSGGSYIWLEWGSTYQIQYRKVDGAGKEQIVSWFISIPKETEITASNDSFEMHMIQFVAPATGLAMYQLSGSAQRQSSGQPLQPRFDIAYVKWSDFNQQAGFVSVSDGTKYYRKIK